MLPCDQRVTRLRLLEELLGRGQMSSAPGSNGLGLAKRGINALVLGRTACQAVETSCLGTSLLTEGDCRRP